MQINFLSITISAILLAGVYATMSYGLALIYGVMKIINLSHAGIIMLGAYIAYSLHEIIGLDPVFAPLIIVPSFFLLGMVLERLLVHRLRNAAPIASLLLLFGLWLVLQNIAYLIWTGDNRAIVTPYTYSTFKLPGDVAVPYTGLYVFIVAVLTLIALQLFLTKTFTGRAIRAISQDRDAAMLSGINSNRISMLTFGLGVALSGLAGALLSILYSFTPELGRVELLKSFCIIVLGGLQSFSGVALGALVLALAESWSIIFLKTSLKDIISFVVLVVVLVIMPNGLIGLLRDTSGWFSRHARPVTVSQSNTAEDGTAEGPVGQRPAGK